MPTTTGETNLPRLLATMKPLLQPGEYIFCTTSDPLPSAAALAWFREPEGITLIMPRAAADAHGLPYTYVAAWLTLTVHSSLAAVGLTAAVAAALTRENISCNVVAAYYHDHLFVAQADATRAMRALERLAADASTQLTSEL